MCIDAIDNSGCKSSYLSVPWSTDDHLLSAFCNPHSYSYEKSIPGPSLLFYTKPQQDAGGWDLDRTGPFANHLGTQLSVKLHLALVLPT